VSGDMVGADPELLRALGRTAGALGEKAESVRDAALAITDAGVLDPAVGAPLATLADEALLLARLAEERADALEAAASGLVLGSGVVAGPALAPAGGSAALDALTAALDDGAGSTGMTALLAIETLRLQRAQLDADGDGAIDADQLAAAGGSSDPSVRAAAAFLQGVPDASAAVATAGAGVAGGLPPFAPPAMPLDGQLAAVNELAPAELESVITGWAVAAAGRGLSGAHTVRVRRREISTTDALDELIVDGPVTESLVVRPVAVPDLDDDWLAALADLAPAGTAAMVLVYRREEVHGEYTVDPVPPLPEPVGNIAWAGGTALAGAAALGSGAAAALNPIGVGAGIAVGLYSFVDWLAPDDERRRDTSAIFDVEYRDARGTVLDVGHNMAVLRHEVSGPLFGGPAVIVLPCTPPDDD